jgi:hypothetical protein
MSNEVTTIGSEFQALPLEFIIAAPLVASVHAQASIAATTKSFIETVKGQTIEMQSEVSDGTTTSTRRISAPLLVCVPVPHLRIDSVTTHFKFEINQLNKSLDSNKGTGEVTLGGSGLASLLNLSVKGSIAHESSREATTNRSGMLEITVHASEAEIPAGLQKVLNWITSSIPETALPPVPPVGISSNPGVPPVPPAAIGGPPRVP